VFTDQSVTAVSRRTLGAFAEHLVRQSTTMLLQPNNNNSTHTLSLSSRRRRHHTHGHALPPGRSHTAASLFALHHFYRHSLLCWSPTHYSHPLNATDLIEL